MPAVARTTVNRLAWVLALLAPLQPILALDCSCGSECSVTKTSNGGRPITKCSKSHAGCGHRHAPPAHSSESKNGDAWGNLLCQWLPGCRPCECPQGCDCHLRHLTRLGILSAPATRVQKDLSGVPLGQMQMAMPATAIALLDDSCPRNLAREMPALAVCALLCRFAS